MDRPTKEGLGASDVPGIAGASPFAGHNASAIWLDRMGLAPAQVDTDAMANGRRLERTILAMTAEQTGTTIHHNGRQFRHPDWPKVPLWATPDGLTRPRRELVEVKWVGYRWGDWADGVPAYVNLQVQAQLACLPRVRRAIVGALIGTDLRVFHVDRQPEIQAALPGLVSEWWARHVIGQVAPDPDGPGDQWALLRALASVEGRAERLATPDEIVAADGLARLLTMADDLAEQADTLRLSLAESARDSDVRGIGWVARWATRRTVDWKAVANDLVPDGAPPGLVERHTRATPTFTFRRVKDRSAELEAANEGVFV